MEYYSCDWILPYFQDFDVLFSSVDKTTMLGVELMVIKPHIRAINEQGFRIIKFVVQVSSQQILNQFVEEVGDQIGLNGWKPTTFEHFSQGHKFNLRKEPIFYLEELRIDSRMNEVLKDALEIQAQKCIFHIAEWIIDFEISPSYAKAVDIARELNCVMYMMKMKLSYEDFSYWIFGIRSPSEDRFVRFRELTNPILPDLSPWEAISEEEFLSYNERFMLNIYDNWIDHYFPIPALGRYVLKNRKLLAQRERT